MKMIKKQKLEPREGDIAFVDLENVKVVFVKELIVDDFDEDGKILESHMGLVMRPFDQPIVYKGQPGVIIDHGYFTNP